MLYEMRRYEAFGHNKAALYDRFAEHTSRIFDRHGFRQVGYFETIIGDGPDLTYLLGWDDLAQRQSAWDSFHADPEWREVSARTTREHGLLVAKTHSSILRPLPFSPLQ
ncbi:MAG TPA: NIPSNAP family protein [Amycolatopsis sp.]|nr:NIPSNAP family protein [Amycolatopsis sp.]